MVKKLGLESLLKCRARARATCNVFIYATGGADPKMALPNNNGILNLLIISLLFVRPTDFQVIEQWLLATYRRGTTCVHK